VCAPDHAFSGGLIHDGGNLKIPQHFSARTIPMGIHRVALIFDDHLRPDTTGVHVKRALAAFGEVVHFQPDHCDEIPPSGFDLYLRVDGDSDHRLPDSLHPRAYWAIDTHLAFPARFERSVACDLVFAAQQNGAERLRLAGTDSAVWLPLACDPAINRCHEIPKEYDFSFVGNAVSAPRAELLELDRLRTLPPDSRATFWDLQELALLPSEAESLLLDAEFPSDPVRDSRPNS
jgi:hypothetical protein